MNKLKYIFSALLVVPILVAQSETVLAANNSISVKDISFSNAEIGKPFPEVKVDNLLTVTTPKVDNDGYAVSVRADNFEDTKETLLFRLNLGKANKVISNSDVVVADGKNNVLSKAFTGFLNADWGDNPQLGQIKSDLVWTVNPKITDEYKVSYSIKNDYTYELIPDGYKDFYKYLEGIYPNALIQPVTINNYAGSVDTGHSYKKLEKDVIEVKDNVWGRIEFSNRVNNYPYIIESEDFYRTSDLMTDLQEKISTTKFIPKYVQNSKLDEYGIFKLSWGKEPKSGKVNTELIWTLTPNYDTDYEVAIGLNERDELRGEPIPSDYFSYYNEILNDNVFQMYRNSSSGVGHMGFKGKTVEEETKFSIVTELNKTQYMDKKSMGFINYITGSSYGKERAEQLTEIMLNGFKNDGIRLTKLNNDEDYIYGNDVFTNYHFGILIGEKEFDSIKSVTFKGKPLEYKLESNYYDKYGSKLTGDLYTFRLPMEDEVLKVNSGVIVEEKVNKNGKLPLANGIKKYEKSDGNFVNVSPNSEMYYAKGRVADTHKVFVEMDSGKNFEIEFKYNFYTYPISYGDLIQE